MVLLRSTAVAHAGQAQQSPRNPSPLFRKIPMRSSAVAVLLLVALAGVSAYTWDSCGTRYDRLVTTSLSFTADPSLTPGSMATIVTQGTTDLHMPFLTGAWQIRVYELGEAKSIYTTFGDLASALHFTDPLNTTFVMTVGFQLPAVQPGASNNFTASLEATDQTKSDYCCLEINYGLNQ